ncbi:MAG: sulfite exporter TauE/SafE family protein [Deltaproteobacteria bacterium]|nr:sulfite exporter TauE/SafE family protein [Deltaproteobacteria bacterium]
MEETPAEGIILAIKTIIFAISVLAFVGVGVLFWNEKKTSKNVSTPWSGLYKLKLFISGSIANVFDTLGVGSFAPLTAFDKYWSLIDDRKLPGTLNVQSILPSLIQSFLFMEFVKIDFKTLVFLVVGSSLGGFCGGLVVGKFNRRKVRVSMLVGYFIFMLIILFNQLGLSPLGGDLLGLTGTRLMIGFFSMMIIGLFPAFGLGNYAPTQIALFALGMNPLAAFPIMTTAGTIQSSVTSLAFVFRKAINVRVALFLTASGIVGVILAVPLVTHADPSLLRWVLFGVVLFNIRMLWVSLKGERVVEEEAETLPQTA